MTDHDRYLLDWNDVCCMYNVFMIMFAQSAALILTMIPVDHLICVTSCKFAPSLCLLEELRQTQELLVALLRVQMTDADPMQPLLRNSLDICETESGT